MSRKIDLPRIAGMVFNTPLMMDSKRLDTALAVLGHRILDGLPLAETTADVVPGSRDRSAYSDHAVRFFPGGGYLADEGIAVLPVHGTLARRATWLDSYCGMTSYEAIKSAMTEMMADPSVRGVMIDGDSPGGEAGGVFDLAEFIRNIAEATGKPVWAHANELMASAGYAIASAAETIWIPQTGEVGSIGVVAAHVDVSKADEKAGVRWEYIFAGDKKVDGNPHEPLGDEARDDVQEDVDALYDSFVELVALNRGVDAEQIRDTQAGIFRGAKALEVGLADELGTFDEAMQAFAAYVDELQTADGTSATLAQTRSQLMATGSRGTRGARSTAKPGAEVPGKDEDEATKNKGAATEDEDEVDAEVDEDEVDAETDEDKAKAAALAALKPSAADAERKRCADLAGVQRQAAKLGVGFDLSAAISKGTSANAARKAVLDKAAEADGAAATVSATASKTDKAAQSAASIKAARAKGFKRGKR